MSPSGAGLHFFDSGGAGPPVLLVHAFPLSGAMWAGQVEALRGRHRVVVMDLPGFGGSPPLAGGEPSVAGYAGAVAALSERLGLGPAAVVGLSLGGYVAFEMVRRHRHLLGALVLADTKAEPDTPEVRERRTGQQRRLAGGEKEALVSEMAAGLLRKGQDAGLVAEVETLMDQPPEAMMAALEAMKGRPDSTPDLATIDVPTLFLVGEEDATSPVATARAMHEAVPGSELAVLPGAAHLSNLEAPEAFNASLSAFLERL